MYLLCTISVSNNPCMGVCFQERWGSQCEDTQTRWWGCLQGWRKGAKTAGTQSVACSKWHQRPVELDAMWEGMSGMNRNAVPHPHSHYSKHDKKFSLRCQRVYFKGSRIVLVCNSLQPLLRESWDKAGRSL